MNAHPDYVRRILRVLVHIQQHLDEPLPLERLAEVAGFSPFHFHRVFAGMLGETLKQHVKRLRLERAAMLLRQTGRSVTEVAFACGYETHEAFTRAFRGAFGVPPSHFRVLASAPACIDAPNDVHLSADGAAPTAFAPPPSRSSAMQVEFETFPSARVAFVRNIGPYTGAARAWQRLFEWAGPRGLVGPMPRAFGLYYDDPGVTPEDKLRCDACLVVPDHVEPEGDIGVQQFEGGEYASVVHMGPYEKLPETYGWIIGEWFPSSGKELAAAPCVEIYLNDPRSTPPEELRTKVCVKLA